MDQCPYRFDLPPLPPRVKELPVERGYPVPWFVAIIDGKPDLRIVDARKVMQAVEENRCFVCGQPLGKKLVFVVGPMCGVNRISSEPPSHLDCAQFSAVACPFLTGKQPERREAGAPEGITDGAGIMLKRNPGVTLLWVTTTFTTIKSPAGWLFEMGEPVGVMWLSKGRDASRTEIEHSLWTGMPALMEIAVKEGPDAIRQLFRNTFTLLSLIPQ